MEPTFGMNEKVDEKVNETVDPTGFDKFKKHMNKHKKKYIVGGLVALSFGFGVSLGARGNSKRHYSRLLKDGVSEAVRDGMRDIVNTGMKDVVKDGMYDVVTNVVRDSVVSNTRGAVSMIETAVQHSVKSAIKDSAVTIIKEVEKVVDPVVVKNKDIDNMQVILNYLNDNSNKFSLKMYYDPVAGVYKVK